MEAREFGLTEQSICAKFRLADVRYSHLLDVCTIDDNQEQMDQECAISNGIYTFI